MIPINKRSSAFIEFCERAGVRTRGPEVAIFDAIFTELNRLAGVKPTEQKVTEVKVEEPASDSEADREYLVRRYEEKFGKKPHHMLKAEKIQAAIDEE